MIENVFLTIIIVMNILGMFATWVCGFAVCLADIEIHLGNFIFIPYIAITIFTRDYINSLGIALLGIILTPFLLLWDIVAIIVMILGGLCVALAKTYCKLFRKKEVCDE